MMIIAVKKHDIYDSNNFLLLLHTVLHGLAAGQVEKEAKQLQDTLSKEQLVQFQLLQSDSKKVEDQRTQFLNQLQAADAAKQTMEERMAELKTLNSQLEAAKVRYIHVHNPYISSIFLADIILHNR